MQTSRRLRLGGMLLVKWHFNFDSVLSRIDFLRVKSQSNSGNTSRIAAAGPPIGTTSKDRFMPGRQKKAT